MDDMDALIIFATHLGTAALTAFVTVRIMQGRTTRELEDLLAEVSAMMGVHHE